MDEERWDEIVEEYLNLGLLDEELKTEQFTDVLSGYFHNVPISTLEVWSQRIVHTLGDEDEEERIKRVIQRVVRTGGGVA